MNVNLINYSYNNKNSHIQFNTKNKVTFGAYKKPINNPVDEQESELLLFLRTLKNTVASIKKTIRAKKNYKRINGVKR